MTNKVDYPRLAKLVLDDSEDDFDEKKNDDDITISWDLKQNTCTFLDSIDLQRPQTQIYVYEVCSFGC